MPIQIYIHASQKSYPWKLKIEDMVHITWPIEYDKYHMGHVIWVKHWPYICRHHQSQNTCSMTNFQINS